MTVQSLSYVLGFVLDRGHAVERGVQAFVVEPGNVFEDRELELRAGLPQMRSRISSVFEAVATKLSASALS